MSDHDDSSCSYLLDDDLLIVGIDANFERFAAANGAPELCGSALTGRSVLSCISDGTTAELYQRLFSRVRLTGSPVSFPIRCDAPGLRRFLQIDIEPRRPSGLLVRSTVTRDEPRHYVAFLDRQAARAEDRLLVVCGWCNAVDLEGRWCEVEEAMEALRVLERDRLPVLSHGICEDCLQRMKAA